MKDNEEWEMREEKLDERDNRRETKLMRDNRRGKSYWERMKKWKNEKRERMER